MSVFGSWCYHSFACSNRTQWFINQTLSCTPVSPCFTNHVYGSGTSIHEPDYSVNIWPSLKGYVLQTTYKVVMKSTGRECSEGRMTELFGVKSFISKIILLLIWTLSSIVTQINVMIFHQILIFKSQYSIVCFCCNFLRNCWGKR